jgi:hypothetical protein
MTIAPPIASTSHLVDENAQPHLRRHHGLDKLSLVVHGQSFDALLDCRQSTRHGRKCSTRDRSAASNVCMRLHCPTPNPAARIGCHSETPGSILLAFKW